MNELKQLEKKYEELGQEIERLKQHPKGFDFRMLKRKYMPGILISLLENNFAFILKDDNHKTMNQHIGTMQAGIIIKEHFNRIRGGEIDWGGGS